MSDAAAFDAAGADALWIDTASDPRLDPLAVAAALATLTFRSLLVTAVPGELRDAPVRTRTLATIGRLSQGRLALAGDRPYLEEVAAGDGPGPGGGRGAGPRPARRSGAARCHHLQHPVA